MELFFWKMFIQKMTVMIMFNNLMIDIYNDKGNRSNPSKIKYCKE